MTAALPFDPHYSAHEALAWSRGLVDPALREAVDTLSQPLRHVAGYQFGWWDEHARPTEHGGKGLRPALVLLTAEAVGGSTEAALPAAVAVELVHNFSLLHDDVMDHDTTRRQRPTAWSVFGVSAAILTGDALLSLASGVLADGTDPTAARLLADAVHDLIHGQIMDLAFERRTDVDLDECLRMARAKTGALLGGACALGATYGKAEPERIAALRAFGDHLGLAFQHIDDILGIWGDPVVTGKPAYSDLHGRKKTLPVVAALTSGTLAGRDLASRYHQEAPLSAAESIATAELIESAGGRAWSQTQADELLTRALQELRAAAPVARATDLAAVAYLATQRDQ